MTAGNLTFQRLVVTSDDLGPSLPRMRILYAHGAVFVDYTNATTMVSPILVSDRVVGYDTAVYGVNNGTVSGADAGCRITAVITPSTRVDKSTHRHAVCTAMSTTTAAITHSAPPQPPIHPSLIATHPPTKTSIAKLNMHACTSTTTTHHARTHARGGARMSACVRAW